MTSYRTPQPPVTVFPDMEQQNFQRRIYERLDNLEQVTQAQSVGALGRQAPAPPSARMALSTNDSMKGHVYIRLTNPEFLPGKKNRFAAPIRHQVQASPTPQFKRMVTDFGISHQTYFDTSELGSGTFYVKFRSTFDGKTFNGWSAPQKVVIP